MQRHPVVRIAHQADGMVNVIVVPPAADGRASIVPPCASTRRLAIASPSPVPPASADVTNRSNTNGSWSAAIPGPVSSTSNVALDGLRRDADRDGAVRRGVPDRVRQQVGQHLREADGVGFDRGVGSGTGGDRQRDAGRRPPSTGTRWRRPRRGREGRPSRGAARARRPRPSRACADRRAGGPSRRSPPAAGAVARHRRGRGRRACPRRCRGSPAAACGARAPRRPAARAAALRSSRAARSSG